MILLISMMVAYLAGRHSVLHQNRINDAPAQDIRIQLEHQGDESTLTVMPHLGGFYLTATDDQDEKMLATLSKDVDYYQEKFLNREPILIAYDEHERLMSFAATPKPGQD